MTPKQISQILPLDGVRRIYQVRYRRHMQGDR